MPYTQNPHLPRIRLQAANLVLKEGWSTRQVARHTGFNQSTVVRWVNYAKTHNIGHTIPTKSSRPHAHPKQLSPAMIQLILDYRIKHRRCAEVLHHLLQKDGYVVSLSSIKRVLRRNGMTRYSKWKKWHQYEPRPLPEKPGILVEIDTIHDGAHDDRLYIYTMIDVCSRWAYAFPCLRISAECSWDVVQRAQPQFPFHLQLLQSDHGPEFSKHFKNNSKHMTSSIDIHTYGHQRRMGIWKDSIALFKKSVCKGFQRH